MKLLKRKRIRKWDAILGKRFFSASLGFFTVKKVWKIEEYCKSAETPEGSHWFSHYTMKIKTDNGEVLIVRKLDFDIKNCFEQDYPKGK